MSKKNQESRDKQQAAVKGSKLGDYVWANIIFLAFLFILSGVVWQSVSNPGDDPAVTQVLKDAFRFLIYLFAGGFLLVTLFDAAFEFFAEQAEAGDETPAS